MPLPISYGGTRVCERERHGRLAKALLVVVLLPVGAALSLPSAAVAKAAVHVGDLPVGGALFWDGAYVESERLKLQATAYFMQREFVDRQNAAVADPCVTDTSPCWHYTFDVAAGGAELRVATDTANRAGCYAVELIDPFGAQKGFPVNCPVVRPGVFSPERFNLEVRVPNPVAGTWTAKVVLADGTDWAFRMRAALVEPIEEPELLTPNLIAWVPHEFGFVAPGNPHPLAFRDNVNEIGAYPISCATEEMAEEGARRCLRFSSGVHNAGHGPLHVKFDEQNNGTQHTFYSDDTPGNYSDNESLQTPSGHGEFHLSHEHRHLEGMLHYQLFRVTNPAPAPPYDPAGKRLVPVGTSAKRGFCTGPYAMSRWRSFNQDVNRAVSSIDRGDCDRSISLDKGWGDQYRWTVPGQYIEYSDIAEVDGTMPPGVYMLRVTIDPDNLVLETNDMDNSAYAVIRVIPRVGTAGDRVVICERGFGRSAWDPHKKVEAEPFWWPMLKSGEGAPGEC